MLLLIVQIAGGTGPFAAPWKGPALMVTFGVVLGIYIAWQWVFNRTRRNLCIGGLLLCPRCRHPVLADEQEGYIRCPECGYRNATELVRDSWEARYWITLAHLRTADMSQHLDIAKAMGRA